MRPILCGHRGAAALAPENSISGIETAIRHGMDAIEIDVRCSLDHVPVLMHDLNCGRTTDVARDVDALKWRDLRDARLHPVQPAATDSATDPDPAAAGPATATAETIPRLIDALDSIRGRIVGVLELKPPTPIEPVLQAIRYAGAERDVILMSFDRDMIQEIARDAPKLRLGLIADESEVVTTFAEMRGIPIVSCRHDSLTARRLHQQHRIGLQVWTWTVNEPARMRELADYGVDAIISDYPDRLQQVFQD